MIRDLSLMLLGILLGLIVGMWLGFVAGTVDSNQLLKECQKDLPRSQNCVLKAIPEGNDNEED